MSQQILFLFLFLIFWVGYSWEITFLTRYQWTCVIINSFCLYDLFTSRKKFDWKIISFDSRSKLVWISKTYGTTFQNCAAFWESHKCFHLFRYMDLLHLGKHQLGTFKIPLKTLKVCCCCHLTCMALFFSPST